MQAICECRLNAQSPNIYKHVYCSCGKAAKLLKTNEKVSHKKEFLVYSPAAEPRLSFTSLLRDAVISLMKSNVFTKLKCCVRFDVKRIRTHHGYCAQKFLCNDDIVHIFSKMLNVNRTQQYVNNHMNFRAATAAVHSVAGDPKNPAQNLP